MISCGGGPAGNGLGTLVCLPLFLAYMVEHWRGGPTTCGRKADIGAMHKVDSRTIAFMVSGFVLSKNCVRSMVRMRRDGQTSPETQIRDVIFLFSTHQQRE